MPSAEEIIQQYITADLTELQQALANLAADGYSSAALALAMDPALPTQLRAAELFGDNAREAWSDWQPGDVDAARMLADGGFGSVLDAAGIGIKGMDDTLMERLGNAMEEGAARGGSVEEIAGTLMGIVDDPARAYMIANTELARFTTMASMDSYAANGVLEWNWLLSPGACKICQSQGSSNPHPVGSDMQPPAHPHCRCSTSPVESSILPPDESSPLAAAASAAGGDIAVVGSAALQESFDAAESVRQSFGAADYGTRYLNVPGTEDQMSALQRYLGEYGRPTNALLRDPESFARWATPDSPGWDASPDYLAGLAQRIQEMMARTTLPEDVTVARGVVATEAFDPATLKVGSYFADPAFYSSTTKLQEALEFASGDSGLASRGIVGEGWTIISEAPKGINVLPGAGYQNELLFPPGTTQQVLRVDTENHVVYTRMVRK